MLFRGEMLLIDKMLHDYTFYEGLEKLLIDKMLHDYTFYEGF